MFFQTYWFWTSESEGNASEKENHFHFLSKLFSLFVFSTLWLVFDKEFYDLKALTDPGCLSIWKFQQFTMVLSLNWGPGPKESHPDLQTI